jgi:signal transduction histidine kinase
VVISLLTNAVDAMPRGGTLEVGTRARNGAGGGVECAIRDDGPGIAPEHQERIFDPFFTTKGPGVGVGLGLSSSLRIMQRHNGLIEVRSRPGEGTTFVLSFPPPGS